MPVPKLNHLPTLPSLLLGPNVPLIHRDISWLQFNDRVLSEASSSANPVLERVKFLAISASNLDEFFMVRFQSLKRKKATVTKNAPILLSLRRLNEIRANLLEDIAEFGSKQIETLDRLIPALEAEGIHLILRVRDFEPLRDVAKKVFEEQILKYLPPPELFHPTDLRQLKNLQKCLIFQEGIWLRIPKELPDIIVVPRPKPEGGGFFFFLDDLLLTFMGKSLSLGTAAVLRLTRDSDYTSELDDQDPVSIPEIVKSRVGARELGVPVRAQYRGEFDAKFIAQAMRALRLTSNQFLPAATSLCLPALWTVVKESPKLVERTDRLMLPVREPSIPIPFQSNGQLFAKVLKHDYLLHHPYDAFNAFEEWLRTSCLDSGVTQIELTIYRSSKDSPLKEALKRAAKIKKIRVFIELRARFDELNNLSLAEELREAGVEVYFGFGRLKLHAKIALITRKNADGTEVGFTHLSTGNYNSETARQYTDLGILTADKAIAADARKFFDALMERKVPKGFQRLVSAPDQLHQRLLEHIALETEAAKQGKKTHIVAKVNALVDDKVISALYEASAAGVSIDLIVRGACSLVPGVNRLSRNIRVISLVDRYLEHSRIYFFESQRAMYLSSADLMPRNLYSRMEIAFPVTDARLYDFLKDVLIPTYLGDNQKAWELTQQGTWKKRPKSYGAKALRAQFYFDELAANQYRNTPLFER